MADITEKSDKLFAANRVKGHTLPPPRLTRSGAWLIFKYAGMPLLVILLIVDLVLYLFFSLFLERCYGLLCFF